MAEKSKSDHVPLQTTPIAGMDKLAPLPSPSLQRQSVVAVPVAVPLRIRPASIVSSARVLLFDDSDIESPTASVKSMPERSPVRSFSPLMASAVTATVSATTPTLRTATALGHSASVTSITMRENLHHQQHQNYHHHHQQHRKSSYQQQQHSSKLLRGMAGYELSNLARMRNSALGKSAPSLSSSMKELDISSTKKSSGAASAARSTSFVIHRLSLMGVSGSANISAPHASRSHSPVSASPVDSPRLNSPNFSYAPPVKRLISCRVDGRRWSVASLPSSGYGTTPGSSNISSQCSSHERLHQLQQAGPIDELRMMAHHFSSNDSNPTLAGTSDGAHSCCGHHFPSSNLAGGGHHGNFHYLHHHHQHSHHHQHHHHHHLHRNSSGRSGPSGSSIAATAPPITPSSSSLTPPPAMLPPPPSTPIVSHAISGSGSVSSPSGSCSSGGGSSSGQQANNDLATAGPLSGHAKFRPRSRSLSSPCQSPIVDSEIAMMNILYKERFPKATQQMEERLSHFIAENRQVLNTATTQNVAATAATTITTAATVPPNFANYRNDTQPIVRFVHHQVLEMARDCLNKSRAKLITSRYFYEMSENLERLLIETREKSPQAAIELTGTIKKLLLIISRAARLVECLEFDPEEFYYLLEAAEGQARTQQVIKADIPQYIIHKLGLTRDPIADLQHELQLSSTQNNEAFKSDSNNQLPSETHNITAVNDALLKNNKKLLTQSEHATSVKTVPLPFLNAGKQTSEAVTKTTTIANNSASATVSVSSNPTEIDFDVLKLISNGAYGAVYLVKHKSTRQRFAMKKINKNNLMLRNQVEQVFAERDILSFADNPFVVSMYCSFETKKHLCLVMEYVEGGDCATLLKNIGPLPSDMARFYFAETVLAVEYLHSYGIVHRDLKPDNLLITALGHIKLTDFGLSKMGLMSLATNLYEGYLESETRQFSDKQVFGTPEYIAPEVILRQGYGKPVDWWSMGIILYEFLIGCVPFFGETPEELFAHTVNDDIEWPDGDDWSIAAEAKDLIVVLLQQNPKERLGTGGANELKEHPYLLGVDWNSLLRQKAEFVPQLASDEDTSYFDSRMDRYNHDLDDDTDDMDDSPLFGSFSSYTSNYRKQHSGSTSTPSLSRNQSLASSDVSSAVGRPIVVMPGATVSLPPVPTATTGAVAQITVPVISSSGLTKILPTPELRKVDSSIRLLRLPSTPDTDYMPEFLNTPDREEIKTIHQYLKQHQSTCLDGGSPNIPLILEKNRQLTLGGTTRKIQSTPESSQTDSDDVSPQIQRKRKSLHHSNHRGGHEMLPRFSISMEDEHSGPDTGTSSSENTRDISPQSSSSMMSFSKQPHQHFQQQHLQSATSAYSHHSFQQRPSRTVVKSASALGLSLMVLSSDDSLSSFGSTLAGGPGSSVSVSGGGGDNDSLVGCGGGGSSTASSRDTSPCRELSPLCTNLKPPIIIRRGPLGYGFTVHTIRVYYGDTNFYTMHHLVMAVDEGSPAFEAGLRPADLITHINGEPIQGLYHTQVLHLLLSGAEHVTLRATPLEHTSIQSGGRKRELWQSRLAKKSVNRQTKKSRKDSEKKRKTSLFRRISSKKASAEIQQIAAGLSSPTCVSASRSFQSFTGSLPMTMGSGSPPPPPSIASLPPPPPPSVGAQLFAVGGRVSANYDVVSVPSAGAGRHQQRHHHHHASNSSASSSPSTSAPNTPTSSSRGPPLYQRPSTLYGLKHKLQSSGVAAAAAAVAAVKAAGSSSSGTCIGSGSSTSGSVGSASPGPNRRKSIGHIPLSPLARTPSPSPLPASPTRSPSPLAFPACYQPGSSNQTQSYSPSGGLSTPPPSLAQLILGAAGASGVGGTSAGQSCLGAGAVTSHLACNNSGVSKKTTSFGRPKSTEPSSPLLRRALSPDRLHPRSAEIKCTLISPLCCLPQQQQQQPAVATPASLKEDSKAQQAMPPLIARATSNNWRPSSVASTSAPSLPPLCFESAPSLPQSTVVSDLMLASSSSGGSSGGVSGAGGGNSLPPNEQLPRIAEEKDSPTNSLAPVLDKHDSSASP